MVTRQPIVSVLGHVDHGKTSLLDKIRGTSVVTREAGRITQHIGATEVPLSAIRQICGALMEGRSFKVPGLLFIDTPGHRAFSTLRARGGALADIAVVVVDLNEGLMPQTKEALKVLKKNKTPFVVAANKVDRVHGWQSTPGASFLRSFGAQTGEIQTSVEARIYELIGQLYNEGYASDRYDRVTDFTKNVAIVPVSATKGEGLPDLLLVITGLAQRFLEESLEVDLAALGRATVLEVKEERGLGATVDIILYDGKLSQGQTIVVGTATEPLVTTIRALLKPKPMDEMRDPRDRFDSVSEVTAAAGLKVLAPDLERATAGSPLYAASPRNVEEVKALIASELRPNITLEDAGVLVRADTLGSLEAVAFELREAKVPVRVARVGNVTHRDVIEAATYTDPAHRCILAFNVGVLPDAEPALHDHGVRLIRGDVLYSVLDEYQAFLKELRQALEGEARETYVFPGKLLFLPDHSFRVSKPAILGVRVIAGRIRQEQRLMRQDGESAGSIKSIRKGDETLTEALQGDEVAIAVDGVTLGRQVNEGDTLYVDMPESHFRELGSENLTADEVEIMEEVATIKRRAQRFWGI